MSDMKKWLNIMESASLKTREVTQDHERAVKLIQKMLAPKIADVRDRGTDGAAWQRPSGADGGPTDIDSMDFEIEDLQDWMKILRAIAAGREDKSAQYYWSMDTVIRDWISLNDYSGDEKRVLADMLGYEFTESTKESTVSNADTNEDVTEGAETPVLVDVIKKSTETFEVSAMGPDDAREKAERMGYEVVDARYKDTSDEENYSYLGEASDCGGTGKSKIDEGLSDAINSFIDYMSAAKNRKHVEAVKKAMSSDPEFADIVKNGFTKAGKWRPGYRLKFETYVRKTMSPEVAKKLGFTRDEKIDNPNYLKDRGGFHGFMNKLIRLPVPDYRRYLKTGKKIGDPKKAGSKLADITKSHNNRAMEEGRAVTWTSGEKPDKEYLWATIIDGKEEGTYHSLEQAKRVVTNLKRVAPYRTYSIKRMKRTGAYTHESADTETCKACSGKGHKPAAGGMDRDCEKCDGTGKVSESVEQVDEVSKGLKQRYITKAKKDSKYKKDLSKKYQSDLPRLSKEKEKMTDKIDRFKDETGKQHQGASSKRAALSKGINTRKKHLPDLQRDLSNRSKGIGRATRALSKEEVELDENKLLKASKLSSAEYQEAKKLKGFDESNYKWDAEQQLYLKEEVEQIDELDRSTIATYAMRSSADRLKSAVDAYDYDNKAKNKEQSEDEQQAYKELALAARARKAKRQQGINLAMKKLDRIGEEEVEQVDEKKDKVDENKSLIKDYEKYMSQSGKKSHNALDYLMSMPKYKRMSKDQMAKIIGDAKRKGIFKESYPMAPYGEPEDSTDVNFSQTKNMGDATVTVSAHAKSMEELAQIMRLAGLEPKFSSQAQSQHHEPCDATDSPELLSELPSPLMVKIASKLANTGNDTSQD